MHRYIEIGSLRERVEPIEAPAHEPVDGADDPFGRVLGPLSPETFVSTYRERAPLHVERRDPSRFASLVSSARLERLLANAELAFPGLQLARADDPVPPERYTDAESRIVVRALAREHAGGATIVLSGAHERLDALGALCRGLRASLGARCQANVYRTPPGARGFGPHHDAHDVFILQVEGTKTFRFHAGGPELPLPHQRFDPATDAAGEAGEEIELHPGDTLYIPRGMMHDALAGGSEPSLHVTVGVFPTTVVDVLHEALDLAASRDVALRRFAPDGPSDVVSAELSSRLRDAFGPGVVGEALERLADGTTLGSRPDATGLLTAPAIAGELAADARIAVRDDVPRRLVPRGDRLVLRRPGQLIEFAERPGRAVEALLAAGRMAVAELPGLDAGERLALARRLVDEGVAERT